MTKVQFALGVAAAMADNFGAIRTRDRIMKTASCRAIDGFDWLADIFMAGRQLLERIAAFFLPVSDDGAMIEPMLTLSTAHLSEPAIAWLNDCAARNQDACDRKDEIFGGPIGTLGTTLYGWFMYVPDEAQGEGKFDSMPNDLQAIFLKAREMGCAYLLFDRDVDEIDDLPTFDA